MKNVIEYCKRQPKIAVIILKFEDYGFTVK